MVQRDLERAGIPYETEEGIADFHAAGRHSHVTGLLRIGATLVEAKELARHTDVRMTMKYTHIGLQDQAKALANLPAPPTEWLQSGQHFCCPNGLSETPADTTAQVCTLPNETTNPCESRGCVADCPGLAPVDKESEEWRRRELNPKVKLTEHPLHHRDRVFGDPAALQMRCIWVTRTDAQRHPVTRYWRLSLARTS